MPLRSRPQAKEQLIAAALLNEIGIAIAREPAGTVAHAEDSRLHAVRFWYLQFTNVCLVIAKALVFRGVLSSQLDRHACFRRNVDHGLIDPLGVHVDLNCAATARDSFKQRLPEGIAAFGDPALSVHPKSEPLNLRTF